MSPVLAWGPGAARGSPAEAQGEDAGPISSRNFRLGSCNLRQLPVPYTPLSSPSLLQWIHSIIPQLPERLAQENHLARSHSPILDFMVPLPRSETTLALFPFQLKVNSPLLGF